MRSKARRAPLPRAVAESKRGGGWIAWVTQDADLYAPGLAAFGLDLRRLILVTARRDAEVCWALEEALRSRSLSAVVGEIGVVTLHATRRLQLAAEQAGIPCFLLRRWRTQELAQRQRAQPIAAVTRWRIAPSFVRGRRMKPGDMPELGPAQWRSIFGAAATRRQLPGSWSSIMLMNSGSRRFLSLWLPHWPTDQYRRRQQRDLKQSGQRPPSSASAERAQVEPPLVLAAQNGQSPGNPGGESAARVLGLKPGVAVADARAWVPQVVVLPLDPAADEADLEAARRLGDAVLALGRHRRRRWLDAGYRRLRASVGQRSADACRSRPSYAHLRP